MKLSERWLREWVNPPIDTATLVEQLTMAGLEVESVMPADALSFEGTGLTLSDLEREKVSLDDQILDIHLTPNRGDCLSVAGIAREVALLNHLELQELPTANSPNTINDVLPLQVDALEACPCYLGRIIYDINPEAKTPVWLAERLRRSGIRSIHPVVDVTNYVLLELGQPMHAFDLQKIQQKIHVRYARNNEKIKLLNEQTVNLDDKTLVIADAEHPIAIAGVMGGLESAVGASTTDIFLECAYFTPRALAGCARRYGLNTDSAYRFERGVDPHLQQRAIERAVQLLSKIVGGRVGPITEKRSTEHLPEFSAITLEHESITRVLGVEIPADKIKNILKNLGAKVTKKGEVWQVVPPSYRYDLTIPEDLIEEIARVYGYNEIPLKTPQDTLHFSPQSEATLTLTRMRNFWVDRGYQEAITYSFTSEKMQQLLFSSAESLALVNPLSLDLSVMRRSLWSGLLEAIAYNQNRQQNRLRLFETGLVFIPNKTELLQKPMFAGVLTGDAYPEQWGVPRRALDFFDLKGDLTAFFDGLKITSTVVFKKTEHPALHPGQSAEIFCGDKKIGYAGALHPRLVKELGLLAPIFLFELELEAIKEIQLPIFQAISKFPAIRRDISFWIDLTISVEEIFSVIRAAAGELLTNINLFDVYEGKNAQPGLRSLAIALSLQNPERTLVDAEVNEVMNRVTAALKKKYNLDLRD